MLVFVFFIVVFVILFFFAFFVVNHSHFFSQTAPGAAPDPALAQMLGVALGKKKHLKRLLSNLFEHIQFETHLIKTL